MELKDNLADYTKQELKALIGAIDDACTEEARGRLLEHFNKIVPHQRRVTCCFIQKREQMTQRKASFRQSMTTALSKVCRDSGTDSEIADGGSDYNINNLRINTPKNHINQHRKK
jgi:hypothetical protein